MARGYCRRVDGRGVELWRVGPVRLAHQMTSDALTPRNAALTVGALVLLRLVVSCFHADHLR